MTLQFIHKLYDLQPASGAGACIHIYFKRMKGSSIIYCPCLPLICTQGDNRPLLRWLVTRFILQRYLSDTKVVHVGSKVDQLALGQLLSQFSSVFLGMITPPYSTIMHLSYVTGTTGLIAITVLRNSFSFLIHSKV
jgi:hypothetical protein